MSDEQWSRIERLLPSSDGRRGRPIPGHRQVVEGIIYRYRCGIAWRDLPSESGPWQAAWKRHRRFASDGTWDPIHGQLLAEADAAGRIDWTVSVDSTINQGPPTRDEPSPPQGALPNYQKLFAEPTDHATGRSRGGLGTKIHYACDGKGRPLAMILGPGQGGDPPMFPSSWKRHGCRGSAEAMPEPGPMPLWATRRIRPVLAGRCCAAGASKPSSRNHQIRSGTANAGDHARGPRGLRLRDLRRPQHGRDVLQPLQTMARHCHPLGQTRINLPRRRRPLRRRHLAPSIRRHALTATGWGEPSNA